jgi:hypothetical protein
MRSINLALSVALAAAGSAVCLGAAPQARAYNPAISGTYTATNVGSLARTNTVLHPEEMIRSTWTITSSCTTAQDCSGEVHSDQGWTAPIYMHDGLIWNVKRDLPNWETCPDGSTWTARDFIFFYPANPDTGEIAQGSPVFAGRQKTTAPSGACGNNAPLYIDQPFRLDRIG